MSAHGELNAHDRALITEALGRTWSEAALQELLAETRGSLPTARRVAGEAAFLHGRALQRPVRRPTSGAHLIEALVEVIEASGEIERLPGLNEPWRCRLPGAAARIELAALWRAHLREAVDRFCWEQGHEVEDGDIDALTEGLIGGAAPEKPRGPAQTLQAALAGRGAKTAAGAALGEALAETRLRFSLAAGLRPGPLEAPSGPEF